MSKAVLVLEMPERCSNCWFSGCEVGQCRLLGKSIPGTVYIENRKLDECPLREMPEAKEVCGLYPSDNIPPSYKIGWNDCLKEIGV